MSQVVLITGCSTGIGRDLVQRLTQSGYTVVATARNVATLDDVPAALKLPLDVTQPDSVNQAVELTCQRLGRIDVLVNNAGYAIPGAVEEISDEQARQIFDVNVYGVMRLIRTVVPLMRQQKSGRIINISSIGGKMALPTNGAYSATKFALEALSDALRLELAPFGIRVVLVEPGPIKTHFDATAQMQAQAISLTATPPIMRSISNTFRLQPICVGRSLARRPSPRWFSRRLKLPNRKRAIWSGFPSLIEWYSIWEIQPRTLFSCAFSKLLRL